MELLEIALGVLFKEMNNQSKSGNPEENVLPFENGFGKKITQAK